jgi:cytochrome c553
LLAYYRCESAAEELVDDVQADRPARFTGAPTSGVPGATPALGSALRLADQGHLRIPDLGTHAAVTIELWLKLRKVPVEGIAGVYAADGWEPGLFHINLFGGTDLELAINGTGQFPHSEPDTLRLDRWTHIVTTYDSTTGEQRLYRDGRLLIDVIAAPAPPLRLAAGSVGAWITGGVTRPLDAEVDEVAFYATALSPAEVRRHYLAARGVSTQPVDFATSIRPLLEARCFGCHGPEHIESQLRLDVRDSVLRGGESGEPALVPYSAEESHLIALVTSRDPEQRMPPEGEPLSEKDVALLRDWIDQGAPWPAELAGTWVEPAVTTTHWSFQPVTVVDPPAVDNPFVTTGNDVDAWIFAGLSSQGLSPSPEADRRTLIRRLFLDVHGLPPTPEEVARFLADEAPTAWAELVERVLASPRYGERWAVHWLDVIRYGDTHGFEVNTPRDNAWPYRDYVIRSLNDDKPYDQFLREQLAGDQLGMDAATGFLTAAPALLTGQVGKDLPSMRLARQDELHEMIVSVGAGVMGLTVGCARCHHHKFDPISQRDYYELQAIFSGVRYGDRPLRRPEQVRLQEGSVTPAAIYGGTFTAAAPVSRLYRGDPMQPRERVAPDIPAVFGTLGLDSTTPEPERRIKLAEWLTRPEHPLTSRVIANRIWQHHFGTGLVSTPSDFGAMGRPPSHPELIDHLAHRLVSGGWSLKGVHREILLSNTYRQSSAPQADGLARDAAATYLWRYPPWRLEMEPIRDAMLAVSGKLDLTMGGPGFLVFKPNSNYVRVYDAREEWGPAEWRRMVYAHRVRMAQDGVFGAFDCPDSGQPQPKRSRSTTAIQALNLLNSTFVTQQAEACAERLTREVPAGLPEQITRLFELAYTRLPTMDEQAAAIAVAMDHGLATVCLAVFNSNEFLFVP